VGFGCGCTTFGLVQIAQPNIFGDFFVFEECCTKNAEAIPDVALLVVSGHNHHIENTRPILNKEKHHHPVSNKPSAADLPREEEMAAHDVETTLELRTTVSLGYSQHVG
jgi:L-ascorbate metabolism protein UlaG (beta-lactamase superfamily)